MSDFSRLLYLSRADVTALDLGPEAVVEAIRALCLDRERGRVLNAPKTAVRPIADTLYMSTLAVSDDPPHMTVKSLGMNAGNAEQGLDIIGSLITLFDSRTGLPLAVMDGDRITALRTAGLGALASTYLARNDAAVAAFVGCGTQARAHLRAFAALFPLREVRALGRGTANRDALCRLAVDLGLAARPCETAQEAVDGADIVVSSVPKTTDAEPFLDAGWLTPGAFACLVDFGWTCRPDTLSRFDRLTIDDLEQESTMPHPMVPLDLVDGDIQDLVSGRLQGRTSDTERTAFVFRGLALADLAIASLAYRQALAAGVGTVLDR